MLRVAAIALMLVLFAAAPAPSKTPAISIVALYRERMMLPAGATLHVKLADASTGQVIAKAMLYNPHVPVYLELAYEPSNIDKAHVYTVAARILVKRELFFATDTPVKVITQGHPSKVDLLLKRVTAESPMALENRHWTLSELHGHAVSGEHRPYLTLSEGRASGFGGCNRFTGSYKLHGEAIEFMATASTLMACVQENVMETESAFLKALSSVRYWKVEGSDLQLLDNERKQLMRFSASKDSSSSRRAYRSFSRSP